MILIGLALYGIAKMKKLNPIELKEVFIQLQQEDIDLVLVGGQAVNFWATLYEWH